MKIARVNQAEAFKYDTKKVGDERRRRPEGGRTTSPMGFNLWSLRIERRRWIFIYTTLMAITRTTSPPKLGLEKISDLVNGLLIAIISQQKKRKS